jgi:predicted dehydrogenase
LENGAAAVFSQSDDLPGCDGYVVAVPIPDLTPVCAGLLRHKKPVFAEKTLCLSWEDCDLLEGLGGSDYIFAMHKWHYHPGIEALRLVARSGEIGVIEEVCTVRHAWVNDFHGGDVFWTQAVHDLTIVKHLLGRIPHALRTIHVIQNEAQLPVGLTAVLGDKPVVVLSVSGRHCDKISGVTIQGSRGAASLRDAYEDHLVIRTQSGERKMAIDTTLPLYLELKEFVAYLDHGPAPRCPLTHAREVTEALLHLRKQAGLLQPPRTYR